MSTGYLYKGMTVVFSVILEQLVNGEQFVASCGGVWYITKGKLCTLFPSGNCVCAGGFVVDSVACSGALKQWVFTPNSTGYKSASHNKESVSMEEIPLRPHGCLFGGVDVAMGGQQY